VHRDDDAVVKKGARKKKVAAKKKTGAKGKTWASVCSAHPAGKYLSEGAFKRVYKVGGEAFAVADLSALAGDDAEAAAAASELEIAMLVTDLVRSGVCPNFVATYDAFECDLPPDPEFWTVKKDQEAPNARREGRWLYTRMELCGYGDLEGWIGKQASVCFTAETAVHVLFQMCYALFCGRAQHALRHYDIKLLNFLAAPLQAPAVTARYAVGDQVFKLAMSGPDACWAKLADFGTSKIGSTDLGKPPKKSGELFTTIENAPAELLTHGDAAEVRGQPAGKTRTVTDG
jgi:serine/threonine protein kinase